MGSEVLTLDGSGNSSTSFVKRKIAYNLDKIPYVCSFDFETYNEGTVSSGIGLGISAPIRIIIQSDTIGRQHNESNDSFRCFNSKFRTEFHFQKRPPVQVLSVRPKIAELSLTLFGRALHPELFETHKKFEVLRSNYFAKLEITNSGHVFYFENALTKITEVTASSQHPLPTSRLIESKPFNGGYQESNETRGTVNYHSEFQIEKIAPEMFWRLQNELSKSSQQHGIMHSFDSSGRIPIGGISYLHTVAREKSFEVKAFHTFPDDQAIVKTQTRFQIVG